MWCRWEGQDSAGPRPQPPAWLVLWGKRGKGNDPSWHPLACHLVDVMMVARCLWQHALPRRLRERIAAGLGLATDAAGYWVSLWASLHDIGKASPGFQGAWPPARLALEGYGLDFPSPQGSPVPHPLVTAAVLPNLLKETGLAQRAALRLSGVVAGHHGTFPRADAWVDLGSHSLGGPPWTAVRRELWSHLLAVAGPAPEAARLASLSDHALLLLLAGLTCVSDWIGSMQESFPPAGHVPELDRYAGAALRQAEKALDRLGWSGWVPRPAVAFSKVFDFSPNQLQEVAIRLGDENRPGLVIVEAPMGTGKTEAAFWLSDAWQVGTGLGGTYIALPTEATSNQMFGRFREFLSRRFAGDRVNLHLVHGHAPLASDYRELRVLSAAEDHEAGVVAEEWFVPRKRALLAPFGVGTVDQSLLTVLRIRHGFLRLFGLAAKTVVVDEAHAYDTYMSTLLDRLLAWLGAAGAPVIVLSATLPRSRRSQLLAAYLGKEAPLPPTPYPRVTWAWDGRAGCVALEPPPSTEVRLERVGSDPDAIARRLARALEDGGCAVWICNTVGRAQKAYRALAALEAPGLDVDLFHALYPYADRTKREQRALARFARRADRPFRAVLVATQVVEQSLDLDFDLMVTDLAPVDLLFQRLGRLHRHPETLRPPKLTSPELWLTLSPDPAVLPDFTATSPVYDEYLLLRSWLALAGRASLKVPDDIEPLVQEVYDAPPPSGLQGELAQRLQAARDRMRAAHDEQAQQATCRLIGHPSYPDNILEAFTVDLDEEDPNAHVAFQALTRLGPPNVSLVCLHAVNGQPSLTPDGSEPLDLERTPSLATVEQLLGRSLRLAHRALAPRFLEQPVPPGWRKSPFLRHHRCALFRGGRCHTGDWELELDPELGLVIRRLDGDVRF